MQPAPDTPRDYAAVYRPPAPNRLVVWLRSPVHLFVLFTCATLIGLVVWQAAAKGKNTPRHDEWITSVPLALKVDAGQFTPADLFVQNNEHRSTITHAYTALLTYTTDWNLRVGIFAMIPFVILTWLLLLDLLRLHTPAMLTAGLLPLTALIFSLRQQNNWLVTFQFSWFALVLFLVLGLWALRRLSGWLAVVVAAVMALLMLYSALHGILGWVIFPLVMFLLGYRRRGYYIFWGVALLAAFASFFMGYDFGVMGISYEGQGQGLALNPLHLALYVFAYIGNPYVAALDANLPLAAGIGTAALALLLLNGGYLLRRERAPRLIAVWVGLALFTLGAGAMTGLGRGHVFPVEAPSQPLLSRYVTPSVPLSVALVALMLISIDVIRQQVERGHGALALLWLNRMAFVLLAIPLVLVTIYAARLPPVVSERQATCVENYPASRNLACLARLYLREQPVGEVLRYIDQLAIQGLTSFAGKPPVFSQITYLREMTFEVAAEHDEVGMRGYQIGEGYEVPVFFQHAPSQSVFTIDVPATSESVYFLTSIYVDRTNLEDTRFEQDGALFRVGTVDVNDENPALLAETAFDPNVLTAPLPMRVSLNAYRGQTIKLVLQTAIGANAFYDWSMWIDPIIIVRDDSL
jgi:hypothetical protein